MSDTTTVTDVKKELEEHQLWLESDGEEGEQAEFVGCHFKYQTFIHMRLDRVIFYGCCFEQCLFINCDIIGVNIMDSEFVQSNFIDSRMSSCRPETCVFRLCRIIHCAIGNFSLFHCFMNRMKMKNCFLLDNSRDCCFIHPQVEAEICTCKKAMNKSVFGREWDAFFKELDERLTEGCTQ